MRVDEVILHFLEGENEGVEIKLTPPRELYIGRSEESDIFLGEKKISRKHSQIQVSDDGIRITDLESTNGTFVNSKKITEMELKNGDKIKVGSSVIEVQIQSRSSASSEAPTGSKAKDKSGPKAPPKKAPPEKPKAKPKPIEGEEDILEAADEVDEKSDPEGTAYVQDLDDLSNDEDSKGKDKPGKKPLEEDSDLVVEYQTSIKEAKKVKGHETSEKVHNLQRKDEEELGDFGDLNLEVEEDQHQENLSPAPIPVVDDDEASFDRIPDLENLGQNDDVDIALEEEKPAAKSAKPLMGDLSSMGLSDLLQNLHQNKKTGVLTMNTGTVDGKILISQGSLLAAESGKSTGMKAMYRMLTWKNGDFEFQPMATDAAELQTDQVPIEESVETILMEGFRQYDELRKIQKVLPQMEDELALESQLEVPISKLHPKVLDVVQLIINNKKMKSVLDLSPLSDLETSKIVFYLIKKKVIKIKK